MKFLLSLTSVAILFFGASSLAFAADTSPSKTPTAKVEAPMVQEAININTADVKELSKLHGIGEKKAEAIIAWRKENGNFSTVDQLLEVKGIGEATLAKNRDNISI
jgi:competence protein ComEA